MEYMQLSKHADYSFRTLMYLGVNRDKRVTVAEISKQYKISKNHMVKVIHKLALNGYIKSTSGKNGGIKLGKEPEKINLKDLFILMEPSLSMIECFDSGKICRISNVCRWKGIVQESTNLFLNNLSKYRLSDLLKEEKKLKSLLN